MFDKVLIANRGEIALRIMKTLKKMGIKTVAIYSEADTNSLHVQYADEAIYIGPSPATESYLSIKNIMSAVRKSGVQAVHPGYGFLSENSHFAEELEKEGVALIGPSAKAIRLMGDKIEAKKLARKANVNIVPGNVNVISSLDEAIKVANSLEFPVIIKAVAGGGGRGMRVVRSEEEIKEALRSASNEARNSFSDERIFIEKFIESPRHIEIQLLADKYGNMVCLGERECSIQRHHQKVIEEAPSPFIDEETRKKMYKQAISLAKQVGYYSAGTVEFIVDQKRNFYFLEMNTRLQVEHCVTELITGLDIVEQMVRIAAGEKLPFTQDDVELKGWAIESRVYAEDPVRGFLPSSGRITEYKEPTSATGIRIDSGVNEGAEVSMFYDAMIAKLCTYANSREEAINIMQAALGDFVIRGISHNISFLEAIMSHQKFISGDISTKFIEEQYPEGFLGAELNSETTRVFLAVAIYIHITELNRAAHISGQLKDKSFKQIGTRWVVSIDGKLFSVLIKPAGKGFNIKVENEKLFIRSDWILGSRLFKGTLNNRTIGVKIEHTVSGYFLVHAGTKVNVTVRTPRIAELEKFMPIKECKKNDKEIKAPLSGRIVSIKVSLNEEVQVGQDIISMEAMKMENYIHAETKAIVDKILVKEGENVIAGQLIVTLK
jgi:propionyl-CoA carboxylase alpha chain